MKPHMTHVLQNSFSNLASQLAGFLIAMAACAWLAGCGGEKPAAKASDIAATYTLVSVDGKKVPCAVSHEGVSLQVRSGRFIINADGTCSSRVVFVGPSGAEATKDVNATYTREGSTLKMQWQGAGQNTGTVEGSGFKMNNEGMIFSYTK